MALTTDVYQGDSSDTISVSVTNDGVAVTDLTGYTATFIVTSSLGGSALVTKTMSISGANFKTKLTPTDTASLTPDVYYGVIEVINNALSFKKESHIYITVNKQGA